MNRKQKKVLSRIILTIFFMILAEVANSNKLELFLYILSYVTIGYDIIKNSLHGIINGQIFDENFLMSLATVGAIALGDYEEAVSVMLFYQIGELFQSYAIGKSRKNISELINIRPKTANLLIDNEVKVVEPEELKIGSIIIVKVGEKIPVDGIVIEGESTLNTSALTGESIPKEVFINDEVISGCINMTASLKIKTTKEYLDSTVAKVLDLIENATNNKSKSEDFISKFAKYYTPVVCACSLALVTIPVIFNLISGNDVNFQQWLYRAFTFLVISCPCALVISIPLSFFSGIGGSSKYGILIKGSNYLEDLANVKYIVFDKTGTITKGVFEVDGIHHNLISDEELLEYAALCEIYSIHPIAESLKKAYGKNLDETKVESIREFVGEGVVGKIDGHEVLLGNETLFENNNIDIIKCHCIGTVVHIAIDGIYMGHFLINDIIKPTSKEAIRQLKEIGIKKTIMLTGDLDKIAQNVKNELSIDIVHSELLPDAKVGYLEEVLKLKVGKEKVAFVGDGLNDAAAIARSDIGISMGALGSDVAIEAADIVLMDDDPLKVAKAIKIAKKCLKIVYENIYFAIGIKIVCLILGAFGYSSMWMAIFADTGVMVLAVINSIRALFVRKL